MRFTKQVSRSCRPGGRRSRAHTLVLLRGRRQSDELSAEKQCHMGAVVVALQYAFVVRDIVARMMSSLFAAMLCLTLLTCAHLFYVFQGRSSKGRDRRKDASGPSQGHGDARRRDIIPPP